MVRRGKKVLVYILTLTMMLFILPTPVLSAMTESNEELCLVTEQELLIQELLEEGIVDELGESEEENEDEEDENIILNEVIESFGFVKAGLPIFLSESMTLMSNPTDDTDEASLKEALDNAQAGATVTINSQITISTPGQIVVKEGVTLVVADGAKVIISHSASGSGITINGSMSVVAGGKVNIENTGIGIEIASNANLTVAGGEVNLGGSGTNPKISFNGENAKLNVTSGKLDIAPGSFGIRITNVSKNASINFSGGYVYINTNGRDSINIIGDNVSLNVNGGNITMNLTSNVGIRISGVYNINITDGGTVEVNTTASASSPTGFNIGGTGRLSISEDSTLLLKNNVGNGITFANQGNLTLDRGTISVGNTGGNGINFNTGAELVIDATLADATLDLTKSQTNPTNSGNTRSIRGINGAGKARVLIGEVLPATSNHIPDAQKNTPYIWNDNSTDDNKWEVEDETNPSPTPEPSPTPTPEPSPTPTPEPSPTPTPEPSPTPTPESSPTPTPEPSPVPDSSPTPSRRPASTPVTDTTDTSASKIVDVIRDESAPDIQFDSNTETIFNTVFNDTELALINSGESARVFITINDISETVNETDITLVNQALATTILDDFTLGLYLDLKMFKQIGNNTAEQLFNLNNQLSITIEIPEELRAEGREFKLIRIHDGEAEIISGIYDHEIGLFTFETDRFSTYALIYSDDEAIVRSPRTYDDSPLILVSGSNAISIIGIILLIALSLIAFGASGSLVISDLRRNKYLN